MKKSFKELKLDQKISIVFFGCLFGYLILSLMYSAIVNRPLISKCGESYRTGAREKYIAETLNLCLEPQDFPYSMNTIVKNKDIYYWFSLHFDKKINYDDLNEKKKLNIICDSLNSLYKKSTFDNIYIKLDYPFNLRVNIRKSKLSCNFLVTHPYKIRVVAGDYYKNLHNKLFSYDFTTTKNLVKFLNQTDKYNRYEYEEGYFDGRSSLSLGQGGTNHPSIIYIRSKDTFIDDVENFYWSNYLYKIIKIINEDKKAKRLDGIDLFFATLLANKLDVPIKIWN